MRNVLSAFLYRTGLSASHLGPFPLRPLSAFLYHTGLSASHLGPFPLRVGPFPLRPLPAFLYRTGLSLGESALSARTSADNAPGVPGTP